MEKTREFQENIYFCFIEYAKALNCKPCYVMFYQAATRAVHMLLHLIFPQPIKIEIIDYIL